MNTTCDICSKIENPQFLLIEGDFWKVILAPDQGYLGRCYVTTKRHINGLAHLNDEEWYEFSKIVKKLERGLSKSLNTEVFNWSCLMNNAFQSEIPNPHVHWHLRPRLLRPINIATLTFEDPLFGHHYDRNQRQYPNKSQMKLIYNLIYNKL